MSKVVLMLAHSIEEYMQVLLMHELGHEVFSLGAYMDPANPGDDKRPALPQVPYHKELAEVVSRCKPPYDMPNDNLWGAKDSLPQEIVDWGDIFIVHHVEWRWIKGDNFDKIKSAGKRIIWRTVGQSTHFNEENMRELRENGLEIVRYSPKERNIPGYIGEDTVIRFWMDENEYNGWNGDDIRIANVTQNMIERDNWTGLNFWRAATNGLTVNPAGHNSERLGGCGILSYEQLKKYLLDMRCYMYTGTVPASYTLGYIEALMSGIPIVSQGASSWGAGFHGVLPYVSSIFEAPDFAAFAANTPQQANEYLSQLLSDKTMAEEASIMQRERAIENFSKAKIAEQWREFLS